jgi:holo-[acyl-carrier protein] synthase
MAYYPGICMIEIERVRTAEERFGSRFLKRLFTPAELSYCGAGAARHQRLACRIAAKIAVRSALLQAGLNQIPWLALDVTRDEWGKPSIDLTGTRERCSKRPVACSILLSLSHSRDLAVASAIVVQEKAPITVSPRRHGVDFS